MPKQKQEEYVVAEERIVDEELETVIYGAGDKVPIEEARRLGLVPRGAAKAEGKDEHPKARGTSTAKKRTTAKRSNQTR